MELPKQGLKMRSGEGDMPELEIPHMAVLHAALELFLQETLKICLEIRSHNDLPLVNTETLFYAMRFLLTQPIATHLSTFVRALWEPIDEQSIDTALLTRMRQLTQKNLVRLQERQAQYHQDQPSSTRLRAVAFPVIRSMLEDYFIPAEEEEESSTEEEEDDELDTLSQITCTCGTCQGVLNSESCEPIDPQDPFAVLIISTMNQHA